MAESYPDPPAEHPSVTATQVPCTKVLQAQVTGDIDGLLQQMPVRGPSRPSVHAGRPAPSSPAC